MEKRASEILDDAATILATNQLGKGEYQYGGTIVGLRRYCAMGAVNRAAGEMQGNEDDTLRYLRRAIYGTPDISAKTFISDWNDRPRRRKHEVVAKLRKAAELALKDGR